MTRLKEIREDRDIKQIEIASYLNITQAQYCRYETGVNTISIEKLDKLANFYNTSTDYILYRTDERKAYPKSIVQKKSINEKEKELVYS